MATPTFTGDPAVITVLQAALMAEAQLNLQYRMDWRSLKFLGVKKTAKKFKCLGKDAHSWMKNFTDRILFLGAKPVYQIPEISEETTVTEIFQASLTLEMACIAPQEQAVQVAMKAFDDTTRNLFEHSLKAKEKRIAWLQQQLNLVKGLTEPVYVAEKL